jgi:hypothetical protein
VISRAIVSVPPPGGYGITSVMGFDGQVCAIEAPLGIVRAIPDTAQHNDAANSIRFAAPGIVVSTLGFFLSFFLGRPWAFVYGRFWTLDSAAVQTYI